MQVAEEIRRMITELEISDHGGRPMIELLMPEEDLLEEIARLRQGTETVLEHAEEYAKKIQEITKRRVDPDEVKQAVRALVNKRVFVDGFPSKAPITLGSVIRHIEIAQDGGTRYPGVG